MNSSISFNKAAAGWQYTSQGTEENRFAEVLRFHRQLPEYGPTHLHQLPEVARELGVAHVLVKDESNRFGLPSFKILGASWAVYKAVAARVGIDVSTNLVSLSDLGAAAKASGVKLFTCTEGNWGRAVARMAKYMGIPATIYVPEFMVLATQEKIRSEGAEVIVVDGDYDHSVTVTKSEGKKNDGIVVLDVGFEGYEVIPEVSLGVKGYNSLWAIYALARNT
jgi:diaminopropionate ammonia-lyase